MQIFLDSADIKEVKEICSLGIISGITTNPSLMSTIKGTFKDSIIEICNMVQGDISVEVIATDFDNMIDQAKKLAQLADNIVIKLPVTWEGVRACKYLTSCGYKTNMTLCFSPNQALIAAIAGATYVSPFIGRLDDISSNGINLISDIRQIYNNYKATLNTKILAASIRSPDHFYRTALCGADVITLPGKIIKRLLEHPLTNSGLQTFNHDWNNSGLTIN
ncbi:MAG: fructose-6-phosphate aldolase [Rickettsiaceae bacterium]|nr:MAG: fructose-6-phosphate aldolase [Rickettsiaceae bacterium]